MSKWVAGEKSWKIGGAGLGLRWVCAEALGPDARANE